MNYGLTVEELHPKENKEIDDKPHGGMNNKILPRIRKSKRTPESYNGRFFHLLKTLMMRTLLNMLISILIKVMKYLFAISLMILNN